MSKKANRALLYAATNGSLRGVEAALKDGAEIDAEVLPGISGAALFNACSKGHVDIARLLLSKGAYVAKRGLSCSLAPIHAAASQGMTEVVELLVNHGATVDIRDGFQYTPLIRACIDKHVDTVRRLIELGARVDLTDDAGYYQLTQMHGIEARDRHWKKCLKLIQEARKTKLLRCCNPKCGKPGYRKALKLCAGCMLTRYCSRDCQKQHWSVGHKKCCGHDAYTGERLTPFQD